MKIAGRYEVSAKLGQGGMGVVYRAYDPAPMDREVAVKTLHEFTDPLALDLFYKECRALKSFSHPNIVEIFDIGEFEEGGLKKPYFVMPLLPGQTLDQLIRDSSHRLTVDRVVEIISQTCRGLQAAHERGLVHRDLKPSNIFVMADDSVKLIDFGVAHAVTALSRTTGFDKGTLLYMAPEQVQQKPVSVQSDVYALGLTAYEALTRRHPFRGATESAVVQAILTHIPPAASDLNPAVSHLVSRAVHKSIAKQPWNRYETAREFGETLQKALRNEPIPMFDPARMQPRIRTASKALEKGDYQFAGEIVSELESEGNLDPEITMLRAQVDRMARKKALAQLLESARARYEEEEDPLALQKISEVLQLDPTNVTALGLKEKIEGRRSERQFDKWINLARQHADTRAYTHAHEALQNALTLRPKDPRALRLRKEVEYAEQAYMRLRREKTDLYGAAVNAWKNGDVSRALSQMQHVLELDARAPDAASSANDTGVYQSFYDRIRSEQDAVDDGYARARTHLADRDLANAIRICHDFLERYPGDVLFRALTFDIEEQQHLSAFTADLQHRLNADVDLDAKLDLVREAAGRYPDEAHVAGLRRTLEGKRDLVNSIVERARHHEARGQFSEALADLDTLETIYGTYPGLALEKDRLRIRLEQHTRVERASHEVQQDLTDDPGDDPLRERRNDLTIDVAETTVNGRQTTIPTRAADVPVYADATFVRPDETLLKPPSGARGRAATSAPTVLPAASRTNPPSDLVDQKPLHIPVDRQTPVPVEKHREPFSPRRFFLVLGSIVALMAVTVVVYVWKASPTDDSARGEIAIPVTPSASPEPSAAAAPTEVTSVPTEVTSPAAPPPPRQSLPPPESVPLPPPAVARTSPRPSVPPPAVDASPTRPPPVESATSPGVPAAVAAPPTQAAPPPAPAPVPPVSPAPAPTTSSAASAGEPALPPMLARARAAQFLDLAAQSEKARDWPMALRHYENARATDRGLTALVATAVARVQQQMLAEGTDAFKRAREYDSLDRVDDALVWYERAFRNLPDTHPDKRTAGERLAALKASRQ